MEITREEYQQWRSNNVTEFIFKNLEQRKQDYIDALRGYVRASEFNMAMRCEGMIEGIDDLLDTEYEDPQEGDLYD